MSHSANSSKLLVYGAACLLLVQALASALLPRSHALTFVVDIVSLLLMGVATLALARNTASTSGHTRAAWWLLSVSLGMEAVAQVLWIYFELFLRREVPNPFAGDILLFLSWVPLLAALMLRPHLEPSQQDRRLGILDFLLLLLWWTYLYLFFVSPWQYVLFNERAADGTFNALAVVESSVAAVVLALLWKQSSGLWRRFYIAGFAATVLQIVADYRINVAIDRHEYFTGSWYDLPSSATLLGWTIVAVLGSGLVPVQEQPDAPSEQKYWMWISRLAGLVRLSLPVLAALALLDLSLPNTVRIYRVLLTLGAMFFLGAVASLRQFRLDKELAHANQDLRDAALNDVLTGVHNRRFFNNTIEGDVQYAVRAHSPNAPASSRNRDLIFYLIDIDHFKEVNDRYGHEIGDQVLIEVTRRISTAIRNSDVLIRWGGEEFLVVSRYTDRKNGAALAKRVLDAVSSEPFFVPNTEINLRRTCSVGWAPFPWDPTNPTAASYENVIGFADNAMYQSKANGRNQATGLLPEGVAESTLSMEPQATTIRASAEG